MHDCNCARLASIRIASPVRRSPWPLPPRATRACPRASLPGSAPCYKLSHDRCLIRKRSGLDPLHPGTLDRCARKPERAGRIGLALVAARERHPVAGPQAREPRRVEDADMGETVRARLLRDRHGFVATARL